MHEVPQLCLNQMLSVLCSNLSDFRPIDTWNSLVPKLDNIEEALTQSHNMRLEVQFWTTNGL